MLHVLIFFSIFLFAGTRQLPVVGPQQLMQCSGRGHGGIGLALGNLGEQRLHRRELPRPGTMLGFAMNSNQSRLNGMQVYVDSDDEEDWC